MTETVIAPQLSVRRGRTAVEFYKEAFGAVEDYRVGGTDEIRPWWRSSPWGSATFWVADESPTARQLQP